MQPTGKSITPSLPLLPQSRNPLADFDVVLKRYPKAVQVPGNGREPSELDALVAYLQVLGGMVDFADTSTEQLQQ